MPKTEELDVSKMSDLELLAELRQELETAESEHIFMARWSSPMLHALIRLMEK